MRSGCIAVMLAVMLLVGGMAQGDQTKCVPLPFVKQQTAAGTGALSVAKVDVQVADAALANVRDRLIELLGEVGISPDPKGCPVRLELGAVSLPVKDSRYRQRIADQGYRLTVADGQIRIVGPTPQAVYYGAVTLRWLVDKQQRVGEAEILDWPDLAVRSVMVDLARANENRAYYERVIRFCARYKINRLHMHLTDDETSALYHPDYPAIMHPHAWRPEQLVDLVRLAQQHYIDVVPEIESLGHARCFVRHPRGRDFLHQTTADKPAKAWAGTSLEGYTNVLCPASADAIGYLEAMYARAADIFPYPELHLGLDEVDQTECARCTAAFGKIDHAEWYLRHVERCLQLARAQDRTVGLWGDMLLHDRDMVKRLPRAGVTIYDWHYHPGVSDESVEFFTGLGFDVMACPALMCHSHMILPGSYNYNNIHRFCEIAVEHDVLGIDTTVWTPVRYMSDVLWPGLAYAAVHSWSLRDWDEAQFYASFADDFFGLPTSADFGGLWRDLYAVNWRLDDFRLACWHDETTLTAAAKAVAAANGADLTADEEALASVKRARRYLPEMKRLADRWRRMGEQVSRNRVVWDAVATSIAARTFTMEHLLRSGDVRDGAVWRRGVVQALDAACASIRSEIEASWDRNRFADDPYKRDLCNQRQHLLDWFERMHAFHQRILAESAPPAAP